MPSACSLSTAIRTDAFSNRIMPRRPRWNPAMVTSSSLCAISCSLRSLQYDSITGSGSMPLSRARATAFDAMSTKAVARRSASAHMSSIRFHASRRGSANSRGSSQCTIVSVVTPTVRATHACDRPRVSLIMRKSAAERVTTGLFSPVMVHAPSNKQRYTVYIPYTVWGLDASPREKESAIARDGGSSIQRHHPPL